MLALMDRFVRAYSADADASGPSHSAPEPQHTACLDVAGRSPKGERGLPLGPTSNPEWQEPPEGCCRVRQRADVLARGSSFESLQSLGSHSSFRSLSSADDGFSLYRLLDVDPQLRLAYLN
jgi:hypothetical protein